MKINIVAAIGKNNEIGLNNQLLWKSKSDLKHFKQLTLGKPIIMGRKTFESLPGILPGRGHIVITSQPDKHSELDGVVFVSSLKAALTGCRIFKRDEVFIIGGASIYEQALPLADELHISHMNWTGEADTFFPFIDPAVWSSIGQYDRHPTMDDSSSWAYRRYTRNSDNKRSFIRNSAEMEELSKPYREYVQQCIKSSWDLQYNLMSK